MSDIVVEFNYLRSNVHMITAMITACVFLERAEKDLKSRQRPWVAVYLQQKKSSEILWMLWWRWRAAVVLLYPFGGIVKVNISKIVFHVYREDIWFSKNDQHWLLNKSVCILLKRLKTTFDTDARQLALVKCDKINSGRISGRSNPWPHAMYLPNYISSHECHKDDKQLWKSGHSELSKVRHI